MPALRPTSTRQIFRVAGASQGGFGLPAPAAVALQSPDKSQAAALTDVALENMVQFSSQGAIAHSSTVYLLPCAGTASATEAHGIWLVNRPCTVFRLRVFATANTLTGAATLTVRLNGAATTLVVALATLVTTGFDYKHSFEAKDGDRISVQLLTAVSANSITDLKCSLAVRTR